jgi:hypothetical protein
MGLTTGADALIFKISSAEVRQLNAVGTIPGVAVTFVSGQVATGTALLAYTLDAEGVSFLQFRAPGSSMLGEFVSMLADGSYLIADGEDRSKYIRVTVVLAKLPASSAQSLIYLADAYDQGPAGTMATAGQASAGQVLDYSIDLYNQSARTLEHITAWIDPRHVDLYQISNDNATWTAPQTRAAGITIANIAPAGTGTLYIRRTIAAGAVADPDLLAVFKLAFAGGP